MTGRFVAGFVGAALFALLSALLGGCKGPAAPDSASSDSVPRGVDCGAVRAPVEPELMAWDAAARAQLDRMRKQGVVAVRYEARGCDISLELLPECVGPKNKYVYAPFAASETTIARDATELFVKVPLGAATLFPLLKDRRALRAEMRLVGSVGLPPGSTVSEYDLVGPECRRATHVVGAVYVGGFAIATMPASQVDASGDLFTRGASAGGDAVAHEGYPAVCDRAVTEGVELGGCAVPLRLSLISLRPAATDAVVASTPKQAETPHAMDASCGTASQDGGAPVFDQAAIECVTRTHQAAVRRNCWEASSDNVKRITVMVTARLDPHGKVVDASSDVADAEGPADLAAGIGRCVANDVRTWVFPEPESEKVLTLPFHLLRQ
jgi:hypothetical protein